MKPIALAIGLAAAASLGSIVPASALDVDVGPGGIHLGRDHYWGHHWRGAYAYSPGDDCRVVISRHLNRFGERVTVRRRICD